MARPIWRGSLSFGLVNVPVALVSAVRDLDVHFNQLHADSHARLEVKRVCKEGGHEVPYEEIGYGYELDSGKHKGKEVVLTQDELDAAQPEKTRTIDIDEFVDVAQIDPVLYDHPYFLIPDETGEGPARAYRLLVEVMEKTDRAAIGRLVLRTKEHLVALLVRDGLLQATTMVFSDELRPTSDLDLPGKAQAPKPKELRNAVALIEELSRDFEPKRYKDCHRQRLLDIIKRKGKGETIEAPPEPEAPKAVDDLLAALERSLEEVRAGR